MGPNIVRAQPKIRKIVVVTVYKMMEFIAVTATLMIAAILQKERLMRRSKGKIVRTMGWHSLCLILVREK